MTPCIFIYTQQDTGASPLRHRQQDPQNCWYLPAYLVINSPTLPSSHPSRSELVNLWYINPKWHAEKFPWHVVYTALFFFCLLPDQHLHTVKNVCVYTHIHTYLTVHRLCTNYCCYQIILRVKHFYTNWERCEVFTGYLSLGRWPGGDWVNMWHWTERLTVLFQRGNSSCPSYFQIVAAPVTSK
jgi:hypothetical protein